MAPSLASSRGVSEGTGVAVLVVLTVVATASVGMTVTLVMDEEGSDAQFTFDHSENLEHLLIYYSSGDELRAGSIHIIGDTNEVTIAELADLDPDETVEPNPNLPVVRLEDGNAWGSSVNADEFIEIRYVPDEDDEEVVLAAWNDPTATDGDDPVDVPGPDT